MTTITSASMKAAFKMMQDFAPAIMKASEILEAAEQAEAKLTEHASKMKGLDDAYASIRAQHADAQVALTAVKTKLDQARTEAAAERESLTASLTDLKAEVSLAKQAIDETRKLHANTLAEHKQELEAIDTVLEDKKRALAEFRRAIPKTY